MTPERIAEANGEVSRARIFGRKPRQWAVDALEAEKNARPMSVAEALDVQRGAAFGRKSDPGLVAEAHAILDAAQPHFLELEQLMREIRSLAESKLGMTRYSAELHARSEAMTARQTGPTIEEAVKSLRKHRDSLHAKAVTS